MAQDAESGESCRSCGRDSIGGEHVSSPTPSPSERDLFGPGAALAPAQGHEPNRAPTDRELASRDADAPPKCVICQLALLPEEHNTALGCGHAFHTECIANYAASRNSTPERSCPFKCEVPESMFEEPAEEVLTARGASLPPELVTQARAAEAAADELLN